MVEFVPPAPDDTPQDTGPPAEPAPAPDPSVSGGGEDFSPEPDPSVAAGGEEDFSPELDPSGAAGEEDFSPEPDPSGGAEQDQVWQKVGITLVATAQHIADVAGLGPALQVAARAVALAADAADRPADAGGEGWRFGPDGSVGHADPGGNSVVLGGAGVVTLTTPDGDSWRFETDGSVTHVDVDGNSLRVDSEGNEQVTDAAGNVFVTDPEGNTWIAAPDGMSWTITRGGEVIFHGPAVEVQPRVEWTSEDGTAKIEEVNGHFFATSPDGYFIRYGGEVAQREPSAGKWHEVTKEAFENALTLSKDLERVGDSEELAYAGALLSGFEKATEVALEIGVLALRFAPHPGLRLMGQLLEAARPEDPQLEAALDRAGSDEERMQIMVDSGWLPDAPDPYGPRARSSGNAGFMRDGLRTILAEPDHPLGFLVDRGSGKWLGRSHLDDLPAVQAGHLTSRHSGAPESLAIEDADFNQRASWRGERQGAIFQKVAVEIGGVPVERATAGLWERLGLLPAGTVDGAPSHPGWKP